MPLIMFAVVYGAARGPRYGSLAMVGLIGYLMGLVTRQPPDTLPIRLVVLILAAGDAALIRHVVLPERPQIELDRLRRAIHAGIVRVLGRIAAAVTTGAWTDALRAELRHDVYRLGEMVMLAQARVAALAEQIPGQASSWLHLLAIELGVERVARVALLDLGTPADRSRAAGQPGRDASRHGTAAATIQRAACHHPCPARPSAARTAPDNVGTSRRTTAGEHRPRPASGAADGDRRRPGDHRRRLGVAQPVVLGGFRRVRDVPGHALTWRVHRQGRAIHGWARWPARWLACCWRRCCPGHEILTLAAIIVAVFLAFQANVAAYGAMVFWITIILGLLFGMLGYFPPEQLLLRLKETAVGAVCGAAVASLVLVRPGRAAMQDATIAFLRALGPVVDGAAGALLHGTPEPALGRPDPGGGTALPRPLRDHAFRTGRAWRCHATNCCGGACCCWKPANIGRANLARSACDPLCWTTPPWLGWRAKPWPASTSPCPA